MCDHGSTSRLSSPTCQDLGIPFSDFTSSDDVRRDFHVQASCMKTPPHPATNENIFFANNGCLPYEMANPNNPFSPYCRIPLPSPYGLYEYGLEPSFVRKRNERERERVRCVNDGYARLRDHLPLEKRENSKRTSKVETLRCAIAYIRHLQEMLDGKQDPDKTDATVECFEKAGSSKRKHAICVDSENSPDATPEPPTKRSRRNKCVETI